MVLSSRRQTKLEKALDIAEQVRPGNLPRSLPFGHVGSVEHLARILTEGQLKPRYCKIMRKRVLYLFYGGLSYRSSTEPTLEDTAYPIGFLFQPQVLNNSDVHYPFDTGAMAAGVYGAKPEGFKNYKTAFRVALQSLTSVSQAIDCPRLIVKHLFGSNRNYLAGRPIDRASGKPPPIPALSRFILAEEGRSDHRRACVETHKKAEISLPGSLMWIGYPDIDHEIIMDYMRKNDIHAPLQMWSYPSLARFCPSDLCARMQGRASLVLDDYYKDLQ